MVSGNARPTAFSQSVLLRRAAAAATAGAPSENASAPPPSPTTKSERLGIAAIAILRRNAARTRKAAEGSHPTGDNDSDASGTARRKAAENHNQPKFTRAWAKAQKAFQAQKATMSRSRR
ncbi:unnamed protein product [Phaeothamnion confervicola]